MSTPFVLVGDLFGQPTGLSRILTDLAVKTRITFGLGDAPQLDVRVVGYANWPGLPAHGVATSLEGWAPGEAWVFQSVDHWGRNALETAYRHWFGDRPGIVLTIWDAHRCWGLTQAAVPVRWWGYVPVDAVNVNGYVGGGLVIEGLQRYNRLLGYTTFGASALAKTLWPGDEEAQAKLGTLETTQSLPHGLNLHVWSPSAVTAEAMAKVRGYFASTIAAGAMLIGTVATNQPRKDWGLVAATLADLRARGHAVHGWWHTDQLVTDAWSLPQLIEDFNLDGCIACTTKLPDAELAAAYTCCAATIAPGRGEGFGYPIVESLAMGTPVVHADYAGGAEFTPAPWRLPVEAYHLEGAYGLRRPIVSPRAAADVLEGIFTGRDAAKDRQVLPQFVAALDWQTLWPRWAEWIREGL